MSTIKLKSNQKLKIKGRGLNIGSLFSRFEEFNLDDDSDFLDNKIEKNSKKIINNEIELDDQIQKKKDIKTNLFEIKNQTKSIKDATPIKNEQLIKVKSINDRLNIIRNLDKELSLNVERTNEKKELIKDKLTNNDLYAKRISRKLNADFSLIRFVVDQIGPKLAFELSNKVLDNELEKKNDLNKLESNFENSNSNLNKNEDMTGRIFTTFFKKSIEIDRSIDLNEKFIRLIIDNKNISSRNKQSILDFKLKNQSNKNKSTSKSSRRVKLKRIKKKVDSINIDFGNLKLTNQLDSIEKNQNKKFDFK